MLFRAQYLRVPTIGARQRQGRSRQRQPPHPRDVRAPQEPPADWTIAPSVPIRTVTKLMLTKYGYSSNALENKRFHEHRHNRVNHGAQMPTPTVRRLSQQFLD